MSTPGRKLPIVCRSAQSCKNPECTYHHASPAANYDAKFLPRETLRQQPCNQSHDCTKPNCWFNHPSPAAAQGKGAGFAATPAAQGRGAGFPAPKNERRTVASRASGIVEEGQSAALLIADEKAAPGITAPIAKEVENPLR
jgi:hypothetical protein